MKNLFLQVLIFSVFIISCSKEDFNDDYQTNELELKFHDSDSWGYFKNSDVIKVNALVIRKNGKLSLESEEIEIRDVELKDGNRSKLISLKKDRIHTNKLRSLFQTGYLLYPDGCFYWSLYIEGDNGGIWVVDACGEHDCVGFDPICADEGEAWA